MILWKYNTLKKHLSNPVGFSSSDNLNLRIEMKSFITGLKKLSSFKGTYKVVRITQMTQELSLIRRFHPLLATEEQSRLGQVANHQT